MAPLMQPMAVLDMDCLLKIVDQQDDATYESDEWTSDESFDSSTDSSTDTGSYEESVSEDSLEESCNDAPINNLAAKSNLLSDIIKMKNLLRDATETGNTVDLLKYLKKEPREPMEREETCKEIAPVTMSIAEVTKLRRKMDLIGKWQQTDDISLSAGNIFSKPIVNIVQNRSATIANTMQNISIQDGNSTSRISKVEPSNGVVKPNDYLLSILKSEGIDSTAHSASSLTGFFFELTKENVSAYEPELVSAIRSKDIDKIKIIHAEGGQLLCCNKFGESAVHMICRHGSFELLDFFTSTAGVPIRLIDDFGRTPFHDACWTTNPNFSCIKLLLEICPDMLLIRDERGFTPLAYVPRRCWDDWCSFLEQNRHLLKPRELV